MHCNEFEVLQCPVKRHSWCEEIHSAVFIAEFSWIIRADRYWISQAKQNRSCWESEIKSIWRSSNEIGNGVEFKADISTMGQKLYSLDNVKAMPNSYRASLHSYLYIVIQMVASISCVIAFLIIQMRILHQHFIRNIIVPFQRAIGVLLLNKIYTNSFRPVDLAYLRQYLFILLIWKRLETKEYKANWKVRILFLHLIEGFIEKSRIRTFIMLLE